jgi:hypothetical protein
VCGGPDDEGEPDAEVVDFEYLCFDALVWVVCRAGGIRGAIKTALGSQKTSDEPSSDSYRHCVSNGYICALRHMSSILPCEGIHCQVSHFFCNMK